MGRSDDAGPWRTIVGVVADVIQDEVEDGVRPTIYSPLAQRPVRFMSLALRARGGDPMLLAEPMRKAVLELDRDLRVYWVRTLDQWIDLGRFSTRFIASIFALAAVAGLEARLAAYLLLVVDDEDADPEPAQLEGGAEPGGPPARHPEPVPRYGERQLPELLLVLLDRWE